MSGNSDFEVLEQEINLGEEWKDFNVHGVKCRPSPTQKIQSVPIVKEKTHAFRLKNFKECAGRQMFIKKWLKIPEFKDWLEEGRLPYHAFCNVCNINLMAGKSELIFHSKCKKHKKNMLLNDDKALGPDLTAIVDDAGRNRLVRIIDLRCDSLSIPPREMRYAMIEESGGDTSFNSDTAVKEFEAYVAELLNMELGLFFPTHVMANLVAVLAHCQSRGSAVIAGDESDISFSNKEALVKFGGLHFRTVTNNTDGTFSLEELEALLRGIDFTFPLTCLVCFECPHTRVGGKIPSQDWIHQLRAIRATSDVLLHCDGTRLANASLSQGLPPSRLVKDCDSVTLAIDKGLGAPLGAVLVGSEIFIERAKLIRDSIGGHIHQAGTFAAAGTFAFDQTLNKISIDNSNATDIGLGIARMNSPLIFVEPVHTNIVHIRCNSTDLTPVQLQEKLSSVNASSEDFEDILVLCEVINDQTVSLMVHNQVSQNDVNAIIQKFVDIIKEVDGEVIQVDDDVMRVDDLNITC